jgi:hypothetical protein
VRVFLAAYATHAGCAPLKKSARSRRQSRA